MYAIYAITTTYLTIATPCTNRPTRSFIISHCYKSSEEEWERGGGSGGE